MFEKIMFTFGDSHSLHIPSTQRIRTIHGKTGSWTMARFATEKLRLININREQVINGDAVLFSFGEIDCRSHLTKERHFGRYRELIDDLMPYYFEAIRLNVRAYYDIKPVVLMVVPPVRLTPEILSIWGPETAELYPFHGTDEQRKEVICYMNKCLKDYCQQYHFLFLDVYDRYTDEEGFLNNQYRDRHQHIQDTVYIKEWMDTWI